MYYQYLYTGLIIFGLVFFLEDNKTKKPDVLVVDLTSVPVQNLGFLAKAQPQKDARIRVAAEVSSAKKMAIFSRHIRTILKHLISQSPSLTEK